VIRNLFRMLTGRPRIATAKDYQRNLRKYRREHPESLEEDREHIQQWLAYVESRAEQQVDKGQVNKENGSRQEEAKRAEALGELREVVRLAFMRHPAATEYDFRRCWPGIREEILKQHALEELAANPALATMVARRSSGIHVTRIEEFQSTNLHLLKRSGQSD
jgi:hypothetical protein